MLRLELLSSLEGYTRAMFKAQYSRQFIVSDHHRLMFSALQDVVDGRCRRLIINCPPRYSKTEVVIKSFISWCFALNPKCRFLHLSYSDLLVNDNSDTIRSIMTEPLYRELFPGSALASEKGSSKRWRTKAGGELYAVSTQGQVTGFGAGSVDTDPSAPAPALPDGLMGLDDPALAALDLIGATTNIFRGAVVIDDPIKPEDAESDLVRERINSRFESTIRNRVNSRNTPIIIIMQRLHEHDLCGYLQEAEPDEWRVLSMPAIRYDPVTGAESALWPMKHTLDELRRLRAVSPIVFETQYMQNPTPHEGLMYREFRTYTPQELPTSRRALHRWAYIDTADTGRDYLAGGFFIETEDMIYITDIVYTQDPMEVTEPLIAEKAVANGTDEMLIESNNGGRTFARNVKRILRTKLRNYRCAVTWFTQASNKAARIFTHSAVVNSDIAFPVGWEKMWPEFYAAVVSYRKDGRGGNRHDDAPDMLTGCVEMRDHKAGRKKIKVRS
jgi:predicted phage terminase large subunit-like protein